MVATEKKVKSLLANDFSTPAAITMLLNFASIVHEEVKADERSKETGGKSEKVRTVYR